MVRSHHEGRRFASFEKEAEVVWGSHPLKPPLRLKHPCPAQERSYLLGLKIADVFSVLCEDTHMPTVVYFLLRTSETGNLVN